jgi:hypothetical protein
MRPELWHRLRHGEKATVSSARATPARSTFGDALNATAQLCNINVII